MPPELEENWGVSLIFFYGGQFLIFNVLNLFEISPDMTVTALSDIYGNRLIPVSRKK